MSIKHPGVYKNINCDNSIYKKMSPLPHQQKVVDYFKSSLYKGLLLYHELGSGKTCTSIYTADAMLRENLIKKVIVLSPGNLRKTWIEEYCKKCGLDKNYLRDNFIFISYNYNIHSHLHMFNFNKSLVIIDEAHNLINGIKNNSKNPLSLFHIINESDCKVLLLSGTPITSNIDEFKIIGKMLNPNALFTYVNTSIYNSSLEGIISYYPGSSLEYYPRVIYEPIIRILMTPEQLEKYKNVYASENNFIRKNYYSKKPEDKHKNQKMYMLSIKRIRSRSVSNFYYNNINKKDSSLTTIKLPDIKEQNGGWFNKDVFSNGYLLKLYSPKFVYLFLNIIRNINSKHVVLTYFKEISGVILINTILTNCGIKSVIYSGDISDNQRTKILEEFNNINNRYGKNIKVLLLTEAGIEGISLKEVQHFHILESCPSPNKTIQGIGRAVRFKSHIDMPKNRREVRVWRYWSVTSINDSDDEGIDKLLYDQGLIKLETIQKLLDTLQKSSI
jgi:superfamily II DNA or RNA helicase